MAANYLQALGRRRIDLLVVSHYHADHANGIPQLLNRMMVAEILLPDVEPDSPLRAEIVSIAEKKHIPVRFIREETWFPWTKDTGVKVFPPMAEEGNANELGLTVLASAGAVDTLITGDMEGAGELRLLEAVSLPDIEVLVVGHHGSQTSTTPELLEAVSPDLALISVGLANRYGHPDLSTLIRLEEAGAGIYRTDLYGTVEVQLKHQEQ